VIFSARTPQWFHIGMLVISAPFIANVAFADLGRVTDDGWHTWRVAASDDAPNWCCQDWNRGRSLSTGCDLDSENTSYGSSSRYSSDIDQMQIYALTEKGAVTKVRAFSAQCPVTAEFPILDLGVIDAAESVRWLRSSIDAQKGKRTHVLAAIAVHAGPESLQHLVDIATNDSSLQNREDAVFWMGQVRAVEAEASIEKLMFTDDDPEFREHAAFSLAQSTAPGRSSALARLGRDDADVDVRSQACFWLAQSDSANAEALILQAITEERNSDVREDAIFALSQLPERRALRALIEVIEDRGLGENDRKQALFWLAQLESDPALDYIDGLLTRK
jgi:HEAT repeat protein